MDLKRNRDWKQRVRKPVIIQTLTVCLVVIGSAVAFKVFPFIQLIENWIVDVRLAKMVPWVGKDSDIVLVTITEETLERFAYRSPLDRAFLAGLLKTLDASEPKAIGIDILFDQATEPEKDALLKGTLSSMRTPTVVVVADQASLLTDRQVTFLTSYLDGVDVAFANLATHREDGTVRTIFPGKPFNGKWTPGLAEALAGKAGLGMPDISGTFSYLRTEEGSSAPFPTFPAHVVSKLPPEWLKGKIVLVGFDLPMVDRHRTPFAAVEGTTKGTVPGMLIHAHIVSHLLNDRYVHSLNTPFWLVLCCFFLAFVSVRISVIDISLVWRSLIGIGVIVAYWVGGFILSYYYSAIIPLFVPSIAMMAAGGFASAQMWRQEKQQRAFITDAFSRYMAPTVVKQLVEEPWQLEMGGEERDITYLFTDIEGFTTLTESIEPAIFHDVLNNYLDGMCDLVLNHDATIDKIVGDAVVSFFGAPVSIENHEEKGVALALALDEFAERYRKEQVENGLNFGRTRIGVNSGRAIIGNFGGKKFFDYTGHGDVVNTAARLEGANKYLGTRICVSGATAAKCPSMTFRPAGTLVLKGKVNGIEVFEPVPQKLVKTKWFEDYAEAFNLMETRDKKALAAFENLAGTYPEDTLVRFHVERLRRGETGVVSKLKEK